MGIASHRSRIGFASARAEYGTLLVADIPFPVILTRRLSLSASAKKFQLSYFRTNDEDARLARIMKGYQKKLPKLMAWKDESAARTVLVLESIDIQLTNHIAVTEAVLKIVAASGRRPDEIFLVDTSHSTWHVIPLLVDDVSVFELGTVWHWDIDSGSLENLTGR